MDWAAADGLAIADGLGAAAELTDAGDPRKDEGSATRRERSDRATPGDLRVTGHPFATIGAMPEPPAVR